jgi:hypothetical protein
MRIVEMPLANPASTAADTATGCGDAKFEESKRSGATGSTVTRESPVNRVAVASTIPAGLAQ